MMEDTLAQRWVGAGVQGGWGHYPSSYAIVRCLMEYQRYSHCDSVVKCVSYRYLGNGVGWVVPTRVPALGAVTLRIHYKLK